MEMDKHTSEMIITLDEPTHIYRRDGIIVPNSVTGLIKKAGYINDKWVSEYGRVRGKLTHLALHYFNTRTLEEDSLDKALKPYFWAYVQWLVDSAFVVTESEMAVYNAQYDYAGKIDIIGHFKQAPSISWVIDTKTYRPPNWCRWQLCLYAMALGSYYRRASLQLKKSGTYKLQVYDRNSDYTETETEVLNGHR